MCLAVPGKIISTDNNEPLLKMGRVSFGGLIKQVSLAYVPQAEIDDYVIVHAGFALSIIDENEAQQTLDYIQQIDKSAE
ncbi:MAG: HypC/HybG/HupF family hydrogenase formation chaperone [Cyanobacteria bacterium J06607_15]